MPSREKAVPSTQSPWLSSFCTSLPSGTEMTRALLSAAPNASSLPSGEKEQPNRVSYVVLAAFLSRFVTVSQNCTSPERAGMPPPAASSLPSGE